VACEAAGTGFAPPPPDPRADAQSGKNGAGRQAVPSACEVPRYAAPVSLCLRVVPDRDGTHFVVQILDVATGDVVDEQPQQPLAELPAALAAVSRWVFSR